MNGKGIRTLAIAGLLLMAMVAMMVPAAEAARDLTATWQNTNSLTAWTYWQSPSLAWNPYCTTYCGYLLKYDWYGNSFDVPSQYVRSKNIYSSYGTNGVIKATTMTDYQGSPNFWGECVSFVKALSHSTVTTAGWSKGRHAIDGGIARGTAIARFKPDGAYDCCYGTSHVAFYDRLYYENGVLKGIVVWDQNWWKNGVVGYHVIRISGSGTTSDANAYYVVQVQ